MWIAVVGILIPLLFVVGTVYNAIKAQKKLEGEGGELQKILKQRAFEKEQARIRNTSDSQK